MQRICGVAVCLVMLFTFLGGICVAESEDGTPASYAGGGKWTARYMADYPGFSQGIACQGNRVLAAGQFWPVGEIDKDRFGLASYDAGTGRLIWSKNGEVGSAAKTVKAVLNRVYTAGTRATGSGKSPMFINAYNVSTGKLLWGQIWPEGRSGVANNIALDQSGSKIFVAGSADSSPPQDHGFFTVLALNATNGKAIWMEGPDSAQAKKGEATAVAVHSGSGRVFAAGLFRDDTNFREGFAVRAYAKTGKLLWEDVQWSEGKGSAGAYLYSFATAVTVTPNEVYVAGTIHTVEGGNNFTIRAYNAETGKLIWQDQYNHYKYFFDGAYALALQGNKLFVGGYVTRPSAGQAFTVRAYDAVKGTLLWSNMRGGYSIEENGVADLVIAGNTLYGAGTAKDGTALTVRAYKMTTGEILWEDFFPQEGALEGFGAAFGICTTGSGVFAGGASMADTVGYNFTVRAYSVR